MEKLRKGLAKIEFYAAEEEIKKLRSAKYNIVLTYEELKSGGKITMSYKTFYAHLKKYEKLSSANKVAPQKTKKLPKKREPNTSTKMIFENDPSKHSRHF